MITRGIVEKVIDAYSVKVRMPLLNRLKDSSIGTSTDDLNVAKICCVPKLDMNLSVGDAVFVGFENNDYGKPVIIGFLYHANITTIPNQELGYLKVCREATLPEDTQIGKITYNELSCISGISANIQHQLNTIKNQLSNLPNTPLAKVTFSHNANTYITTLESENSLQDTKLYLPTSGGTLATEEYVNNLIEHLTR